MEEQEAVAALKAAGMSESQARVLVRVVCEAAARRSPCGDGTLLDRVALQDEICRFSHEVSRQIDADSRFYVACMIGIYATMYVLLRLIP